MGDEGILQTKFGLSVSAALLLGAISMTGCSAGHSADNGNMQTKSVRGTDGRIHVNSARDGMRDDDFGSMEVSKELADRVAAMPEVRSANVIMVGRSAYVAVMLENTSGGVHTRNITRREATGRGTAAGVPGMTGTGGSMAGIPGSMTGTGTVGGTGMAAPEDYPGNGNNGIMSRSSMGDDKDTLPGRSSIKSPQRLKKATHTSAMCMSRRTRISWNGPIIMPGNSVPDIRSKASRMNSASWRNGFSLRAADSKRRRYCTVP